MNDSSIEKIIESSVKAIASQIPIVSGLASLYSDWKNNSEVKNIRHLIYEHGLNLQRLNSIIDKTYIGTEDYAYILHKTIYKAKNEIRENKRKIFADFLTKSCLPKNIENNDKLIFLEILDKIDIEHLQLLQYLNGIKGLIKEGWTIDSSISKKTGIPESRVRFLIHYFISIGLVLDYNDFEIKDDGDLWSETRYFVSDLGVDLIDYLKEDSNTI